MYSACRPPCPRIGLPDRIRSTPRRTVSNTKGQASDCRRSGSDEPHRMRLFSQTLFAWSAWLRCPSLAATLWMSTAIPAQAAQPLPQELLNQWFPVEVFSGTRIPLSSDPTLSPWSLIRLRLMPDERLSVLFGDSIRDCATSGDARLDPDRGRIHIRSHAITCRTSTGFETRVFSGTVISETDGYQGVPLSLAHQSQDQKGYILPAGVQGTLVVLPHDSPTRVEAPTPSGK